MNFANDLVYMQLLNIPCTIRLSHVILLQITRFFFVYPVEGCPVQRVSWTSGDPTEIEENLPHAQEQSKGHEAFLQ